MHNIFKTPEFLVGLAIKLIFAFFFVQGLFAQYFMPFTDYFVSSFFENPYQYYLARSEGEAFPYPAGMLYIMSLPRLIFGSFISFSNGGASANILAHLPILAADILILYILSAWLKMHQKYVLWFYWLSPVLIYINYVHNQLDVLPMALVFASLFMLLKDRLILAFAILGFAVATKTHIAIVIPFFYIYCLKTRIDIKLIIYGSIACLMTFIIVNSPFISSPDFWQMILNNDQQSKLLDTYLAYGDSNYFYFIPASYLFLLLRAYIIKGYNRNIFVMFLGFSFGSLLLFIVPTAGWYYWVVPFLVYFYAQGRGKSFILFIALQVFYILFFLIDSYLTPTIMINGQPFEMDGIKNLIFTLLQTTLILNCLWIYRQGFDTYAKNKLTSKPYLMGISGDSGVGKSTISNALSDIFGNKNVTIIRGDDMHKWERGHAKWSEFTHLNPRANELHQEVRQIQYLKQGHDIKRRHYNHDNGQFTDALKIHSKKLIILEGLHSLYLKKLRDLYDLKVFVSPDKNLQKHWKIVRDTKKRGYTIEKILEQISSRAKDSEKYIDIQANYADIIISTQPVNEITDLKNLDAVTELYTKFNCGNSIYFETLLDQLNQYPDLDIGHEYNDDDTQTIIIKGSISAEDLHEIAELNIPSLEDIGIYQTHWTSGQIGVSTLLIIYYIFEDIK